MNTKTREQQRKQERLSEEINGTLDCLQHALVEHLTNPETDIEGQAFKAFTDQLNHKWKTYCHIKRLTKPAFGIMEGFIKHVIEQFKGVKEGTISDPEEQLK